MCDVSGRGHVIKLNPLPWLKSFEEAELQYKNHMELLKPLVITESGIYKYYNAFLFALTWGPTNTLEPRYKAVFRVQAMVP